MRVKKVEFEYKDKRGAFKQITSGNWKQLNILETKKGFVRGGHYHKQTLEFFYVQKGKIKLMIKNLKTGSKKTGTYKNGECFVIGPFESHTIKAISDSMLVVLLSKIHNAKKPDIFPEDG